MRRLDFLQADDVGALGGEPVEQLPLTGADAVDVPGGDFHRGESSGRAVGDRPASQRVLDSVTRAVGGRVVAGVGVALRRLEQGVELEGDDGGRRVAAASSPAATAAEACAASATRHDWRQAMSASRGAGAGVGTRGAEDVEGLVTRGGPGQPRLGQRDEAGDARPAPPRPARGPAGRSGPRPPRQSPRPAAASSRSGRTLRSCSYPGPRPARRSRRAAGRPGRPGAGPDRGSRRGW